MLDHFRPSNGFPTEKRYPDLKEITIEIQQGMNMNFKVQELDLDDLLTFKIDLTSAIPTIVNCSNQMY